METRLSQTLQDLPKGLRDRTNQACPYPSYLERETNKERAKMLPGELAHTRNRLLWITQKA